MRFLQIIVCCILFSIVLTAQDGPKVEGNKAELAVDTTVVFYQVWSEGIELMTEDLIRTRTRNMLRNAGLHPLNEDAYPQALIGIVVSGSTYKARIEWRKAAVLDPVWRVSDTGEITGEADAAGAVLKLVQVFLKDFTEVNKGLGKEKK